MKCPKCDRRHSLEQHERIRSRYIEQFEKQLQDPNVSVERAKVLRGFIATLRRSQT